MKNNEVRVGFDLARFISIGIATGALAAYLSAGVGTYMGTKPIPRQAKLDPKVAAFYTNYSAFANELKTNGFTVTVRKRQGMERYDPDKLVIRIRNPEYGQSDAVLDFFSLGLLGDPEYIKGKIQEVLPKVRGVTDTNLETKADRLFKEYDAVAPLIKKRLTGISEARVEAEKSRRMTAIRGAANSRNFKVGAIAGGIVGATLFAKKHRKNRRT